MFSLVPSAFLKRAYTGLLCCGIVFLWLLTAGVFIKIIASSLMIIIGTVVYKKKLIALEFIKLKQLDTENWLLQRNTGQVFQGKLQGDSVVNSIFSILILKSDKDKKVKKLLICRDMLPKTQHHQLILRMRGFL